jgi:oxaloacetate decarboxylase alpha subunit
VDLPIDLHTHSLTGLAFMTYLKAVEAGVDIIDTAISPFSGGTSQPATETLAYALRQLGYQVDLDDGCTKKIADYFKNVRDAYVADGTLMPKAMATDTQCLTYQVPGGMLSNLMSQLKQMNALDRFDEALAETPKVRADMGYPPLVTPTSQMVGVQAVRNVLDGQRYKTVSKEIKAYCRGEYGTTPAPIDPEIQKQILGDEKPLEGRYADTLAPIVEPTRQKLEGIARSDEDVLSYIAFPNLAEKFFDERREREENEVTYTICEA